MYALSAPVHGGKCIVPRNGRGSRAIAINNHRPTRQPHLSLQTLARRLRNRSASATSHLLPLRPRIFGLSASRSFGFYSFFISFLLSLFLLFIKCCREGVLIIWPARTPSSTLPSINFRSIILFAQVL
jgi:hypothetical protein